MFNLFQKKDIELISGSLWHMENNNNDSIIFPVFNINSDDTSQEERHVRCYPYVTIVMYIKTAYGEPKWVIPGNVKYAVCLIDTTLVAINYDWFNLNMIPIRDYPIIKKQQ